MLAKYGELEVFRGYIVPAVANFLVGSIKRHRARKNIRGEVGGVFQDGAGLGYEDTEATGNKRFVVKSQMGLDH